RCLAVPVKRGTIRGEYGRQRDQRPQHPLNSNPRGPRLCPRENRAPQRSDDTPARRCACVALALCRAVRTRSLRMALMIGVSGIRGLVGDTLTPQLVFEFAQAYGTLLDGGRVALARDSRPSGEMYSFAAASGLLAAGCEVTYLGIAMTPTIGWA